MQGADQVGTGELFAAVPATRPQLLEAAARVGAQQELQALLGIVPPSTQQDEPEFVLSHWSGSQQTQRVALMVSAFAAMGATFGLAGSHWMGQEVVLIGTLSLSVMEGVIEAWPISTSTSLQVGIVAAVDHEHVGKRYSKQ